MYRIGMKNNEKNVSSTFKFVSPQHLCYIRKHFSNARTHKKETFSVFSLKIRISCLKMYISSVKMYISRLEIKILYGTSDFSHGRHESLRPDRSIKKRSVIFMKRRNAFAGSK